jgi:hypothetical protein
MEESFEIFAGDFSHLELAIWMEIVVGFDCAKTKMMKRAAAHPGDYFVYDSQRRAMAAQIHNGPQRSNEGDMSKADVA